MPPQVFNKLCEKNNINPAEGTKALEKLMKIYHAESEHEILLGTNAPQQLEIGANEVENIVKKYYLPMGSYNPKPLSNTEVDEVLDQLELVFPDFLNLHINMVNPMDYGGSLAQLIDRLEDFLNGTPVTLALPETGNSKSVTGVKRRFASIVNSDLFGGGGKHWVAVFIDLTGPSPTIEFFNSSGKRPYRQIQEWAMALINKMTELAAAGKLPAVNSMDAFQAVSDIQHQKGETECGVYSLFYIYSRLNGVNMRRFKHDPIQDQQMTDFRKKIFRPSD